MKTNTEIDVPLALRVAPEIVLMLENAKKATGRTKKHLLTEALRSKYAQYLPRAKAAVA